MKVIVPQPVRTSQKSLHKMDMVHTGKLRVVSTIKKSLNIFLIRDTSIISK